MAPSTGVKMSATMSDEVRTKMSVSGRNFMNSPVMSCQNRKGTKAAIVVAVEAVTGQNIRLEASA